MSTVKYYCSPLTDRSLFSCTFGEQARFHHDANFSDHVILGIFINDLVLSFLYVDRENEQVESD